jgi:hypothetical protein
MRRDVPGRHPFVMRRVQVQGPWGPAGAARLGRELGALLEKGSVVCELNGPVDLGVVEVLARVHLEARRLGVTLTLTGDDLGLLGLLGLEVLRQPEPPEQRGVEEVVHVLDPPP